MSVIGAEESGGPLACDNSPERKRPRLTTSSLLPVSQQDTPTIGPYHTGRRFPMMTKTKLALAALLLLQIVPAADAASKKHHHHEGGAYSAYDYAGRGEFSPSIYNFARQVYGWDGGPYPFNIGPDGRPTPLTSDGKCWMPSQWGPPEWAPCP
jgi:hypothetical protein